MPILFPKCLSIQTKMFLVKGPSVSQINIECEQNVRFD